MNGQELKRILQGMGIRKETQIQGAGGPFEGVAVAVWIKMFTFMAERLQAAGFPSFEAATLQAGQQTSNKSHNKGGISAPSYNDYDGSQRKPPPQR